MEPENPLLDLFVLSLARTENPRVCSLPTASGDADAYSAKFYRSFASFRCRPADLLLYNRTVSDLTSFVADQDVIYVGGGSTANLLALWKLHGLDDAIRRAWEKGTILCGISAGMNCWFEASVTDSFDLATLAPLTDGLGIVKGSACPHYDGEPERRPTFRRPVQAGELPPGYAADDGAALVFADGKFKEAVASRPAAKAYRVSPGDQEANEQVLTTRYLG